MSNNKKRPSSEDGFYDFDTSDAVFGLNNSNGFLPPSPPESPLAKSPKKLDSSHAAFDAGEEETSSMLKSRKRRKATLPSYVPDPKRVWNKDDELVILKGIIDYRNETKVDYLSDYAAFFEYLKDDMKSKVSKDQLVNKIRKLKKKCLDTLRGKQPCFTNSHDSESFELSLAIWGKDSAVCVDGSNDKAKGTKRKVGTSIEHEPMANGGPEKDDGSAKGDSFEKLPSENVDKNLEKECGEKDIETVTNGEAGNDDGSAKADSFDKLPSENVDKNMESESGEKEIEAVTNGEPGNDDGPAKGDPCNEKLPCENVDKDMEMETGEKESEEIEAVTNGEARNDDGSPKGDDKLPSKNVEERMKKKKKKKGSDGKESEEEDGIDDELSALQDALETTMFHHLGTYAQTLMLQKMRILSANERKELSGEWKSLLVQEALLKSKKHYFSAKLANAVLHN